VKGREEKRGMMIEVTTLYDREAASIKHVINNQVRLQLSAREFFLDISNKMSTWDAGVRDSVKYAHLESGNAYVLCHPCIHLLPCRSKNDRFKRPATQ
jgi:hypothetical protein